MWLRLVVWLERITNGAKMLNELDSRQRAGNEWAPVLGVEIGVLYGRCGPVEEFGPFLLALKASVVSVEGRVSLGVPLAGVGAVASSARAQASGSVSTRMPQEELGTLTPGAPTLRSILRTMSLRRVWSERSAESSRRSLASS